MRPCSEGEGGVVVRQERLSHVLQSEAHSGPACRAPPAEFPPHGGFQRGDLLQALTPGPPDGGGGGQQEQARRVAMPATLRRCLGLRGDSGMELHEVVVDEVRELELHNALAFELKVRIPRPPAA